jgi:hypothetical protein
MIGVAWKHRNFLGVLAGTALFGIVTLSSLQAGLEFASEMRAFREGGRTEAGARRAALKVELDRLGAVIAAGGTRSSNEVAAAIAAVEASPVSGGTVKSVSENCLLNRRVTRAACTKLGGLRQEQARAEARDAALTERAALSRELADLGAAGIAPADPQLDAMTGILGTGDDPVVRERVGLLILVGLVFEVASGLGLYVVTLPWLARRQDMGSERLGAVEAYMLARIMPQPGAATALYALFADYLAWCRSSGEVPRAQGVFIAEFTAMAREIGIRVEGIGAGALLHDVVFGEAGA